MYVSEKRNKVTVADAVDFEIRKIPPAKDLPYWAGSAERAKERNRKQQEAVDRRKIQCQRNCPQDCADCVVEVE